MLHTIFSFSPLIYFVGCIVTLIIVGLGATWHSRGEGKATTVFLVILWPLWLVVIIVFCIAAGPYKLGHYLGNKLKLKPFLR